MRTCSDQYASFFSDSQILALCTMFTEDIFAYYGGNPVVVSEGAKLTVGINATATMLPAEKTRRPGRKSSRDWPIKGWVASSANFRQSRTKNEFAVDGFPFSTTISPRAASWCAALPRAALPRPAAGWAGPRSRRWRCAQNSRGPDPHPTKRTESRTNRRC